LQSDIFNFFSFVEKKRKKKRRYWIFFFFFFLLFLKKLNKYNQHFCLYISKGKQVKIPAPNQGLVCGNATEPWEAGGGPRKSSLFFLTVSPPYKNNKKERV